VPSSVQSTDSNSLSADRSLRSGWLVGEYGRPNGGRLLVACYLVCFVASVFCAACSLLSLVAGVPRSSALA